jgi:hypothetical protein
MESAEPSEYVNNSPTPKILLNANSASDNRFAARDFIEINIHFHRASERGDDHTKGAPLSEEI